MANKPKYMRTALQEVIVDLRAKKEDGTLTPADINAAARTSGYSPGHIRRVLKQECTPDVAADAERFSVTEQVIAAVFLTCGTLAAAWRLLDRQRVQLPSLSTFKRHVIATIGTDQIAYARGGSAKFRDAQVYLKQSYAYRMHSVLLDHTELPIYVVPRGFKHAVKPWITMVMDAATRYPLSWVVTFGRPTAEEVRASLVQAMTVRYAPDGVTVVGGRPLKCVWDRGLEFLATLVTESCLRLHVMPVALPAYSPHLKGRLERFWRFLKQDLLAPLPGYVDGPRDLRGNTALEGHALGEDEFLTLLAEWMDNYVLDHMISTEDATPLQLWQNDGTPLDQVADEQLWQDFLVSKDKCKVSKNGIRWDRIDWVAPELTGAVGRHVEIRYLPHDRTFIEVFIDNTHLCTAEPNHLLDDEGSHRVLQRRRVARKQARARFTAANRLRRDGHDELHKLAKDKDGKRRVVDPVDDLMAGVDDEYKKLVDDAKGADGDDQGRLF